jgi:nitronate monooxygenase
MRVPVIVAPMLRVSGPELVIAVCRAGAMAAFPTVNARTIEGLDEWLSRMAAAGGGADRPLAAHCANLVMRPDIVAEHLPVLVSHRVEVVITSVGSPAPVLDALHEVGTFVLCDVATLHHAERAVAAGVDGLVLLTAGSGGQTGWLNPFAFVRAVRSFYDGPLVLAGGLTDGASLRAALALGADLGYMGTRFIAAAESMAGEDYRAALVSSTIDDVLLTRAFTGLPANYLRPTIVAAGLDPDALDEEVTPEIADAVYGGRSEQSGPKRWTDIVSAGHSVSGVTGTQPAAAIVAHLERELSHERSPACARAAQ